MVVLSLLAGLRIAVTRHGLQADQLCDRLSDLGATPVRVPTIAVLPPVETGPLDDALRSLGQNDWVVFTSATGVRSTLDRMAVLGLLPDAFAGVRVAAVGTATARVLAESGIAVAAVPAEYVGARIVDVVGSEPNQRLLLLRADIADPGLPRLFEERGMHAVDIAAYRTVSAVPDAESMAALRDGVDVITFTSPSTVRGLIEGLGSDWRDAIGATLIASIGPVTSKAARDLGLDVSIEAAEHTMDGLLRALCDHRNSQWESRT